MTDKQTNQDTEIASQTMEKGTNKGKRFALLVVVPLLVALGAGALYLRGGRVVETDNAYVKADLIPVSTEIPGTVSDILVKENQQVQEGQLLFKLDPASYQVAVTRLEARLAQVEMDLAATKASYLEKQAEITLARTRYDYARKELKRQQDLLDNHFVSADKLDDAKQSTVLARQQIEALEQDLKRIAETLGGRADAPVEQHPAYRTALADLAQARLDLSRVEVRARQPGVVSKVPKTGQFVGAGHQAMVLVASNQSWIEANFTETDLTYVEPGQRVFIHIDTYPDETWTGTVDSLSPATGAEFSVIPAQNATGNWVKIAQRVPVRIAFDAKERLPLRVGLSALVEIDTGHKRRLLGMTL